MAILHTCTFINHHGGAKAVSSFLLLLAGSCLASFVHVVFYSPVTVSLQCKILRCNSEFWASTANSGLEEEFCTALRAYNGCVRRTARTCRGDLAYHSAQHGIEDLMSQHNCSKEGPTSTPRAHTPVPPPSPPLLPDSQERSDGPEVCHYERSLSRNAAPPNYTHCGFFGDPHLRTFADDFQTCKVEGAWPLIHNKYLSVQVTNTPVVPGSLATATSKVRSCPYFSLALYILYKKTCIFEGLFG